MVLGQDVGVKALSAMVSGVSSLPLLLEGEEGVGKRTAALEAVCSVGQVTDQKLQREGVHPDIHVVSSESGKEIGIDTMRDLVSRTSLLPSSLPFRFFIVDGAELLTSAAANALLKPLEERTGKSRFVLTTTSSQRVIRALRGRCAKVFFPLLSDSIVYNRLSLFEKDPVKASVISKLAGGSVGRAIHLWKANGLSFRNKVFELFQLSAQGDIPRLFEGIDELSKSPELLVRMVLSIASDLLVPEGCRKNSDLDSELSVLADSYGRDKVNGLWGRLREATLRYESSYIGLPFQLKAAFL